MIDVPLLSGTARSVFLLSVMSCLWGTGTCAAQVSIEAPISAIVRDLCDKHVVLLGELPSHGEARGFGAKARIVEGLVGECGFEAVLFEAPIYEFLGFQEAIETSRATQAQLDRAIGGFWLTRGLASWRRWLFSEVTAGHVSLGGLDDQVSATSDYARATVPDLVAASLPTDLAPECREAVARNLSWLYDEDHAFDDTERRLLGRCSRFAAEAIGAGAVNRADTPSGGMLRNLAGLYERQLAGAPDRDAAMYRNVSWHLARLPEGSKTVIWTATVHAARRRGGLGTKPLGALISEELGDRVAAVGFTAFAGSSSMAGGPVRQLEEAPPGSLETLSTREGTPAVYLDAGALRELGPVPSRLLGRFTTADWSTFFDGVVVFREEVAPAFEREP